MKRNNSSAVTYPPFLHRDPAGNYLKEKAFINSMNRDKQMAVFMLWLSIYRSVKGLREQCERYVSLEVICQELMNSCARSLYGLEDMSCVVDESVAMEKAITNIQKNNKALTKLLAALSEAVTALCEEEVSV